MRLKLYYDGYQHWAIRFAFGCVWVYAAGPFKNKRDALAALEQEET